MTEVDKGAIYLALSSGHTAKGDNLSTLGGRHVSPEEEARIGAQFRRELHDHQEPSVRARSIAFKAASGN